MGYILVFLFWGFFIIPPIIGIIIAVIVYRGFSKRHYRMVGITLSIVILSGVVYYIINDYFAFYPPESFYKEQVFEYNTKLKFPKSGKIISKVSTYPDFHGHYISDALIELSDNDFVTLLAKIDNDHAFVVDTLDGDINAAVKNQDQYFSELTKGLQLTNDSDKRSIIRVAKKDKIWIFFLSNMHTIIMAKRLNEYSY